MFTWHPDLRCPLYEVRCSKPVIHGAWEAPGGVVTFTAEDGLDLEIGPDRIEITLAGERIVFDHTGVHGRICAFDNVVSGCFAGFVFDDQGGIAIGSNMVPAGMVLARVDPPPAAAA